MATRGTIAMLYLDGHVEQIYTHWDSYIEHNGRILKENYNTPEKVHQLIALGDLSILAPSLNGGEGHSFETPEDGVCVAYGRDRGESDTAARKFRDLDMFKFDMQREEYDYLFVESELRWYLVKNKQLVTFLSELDPQIQPIDVLQDSPAMRDLYNGVSNGTISYTDFIKFVYTLVE